MEKLRNVFLFIIMLTAFGFNSYTQNEHQVIKSDYEQITDVINDYIMGTSYNYPEKLKDAFLPNAQMFLDKQGEPLFVLTIEQYAAGVGRSKPGEFNGRTTNILSIDHFEGIAMAKLEVIIPSIKKRFIDMLLLKKLEDGWKIITKTAASEDSIKTGDKVLIVASNVSQIGDDNIGIGNSFSEMFMSYYAYQKAGYHVDFVSPKGGEIPLASIAPNYSEHLSALYDADFMYAISHTKRPVDIVPDDYDIILYTGGSAPIFDIPQNTEIQNIATHIYEKNNGVIATVCHGTAGIVNIKLSNGKYLVDGKNVNGYPDEFENKNSIVYKSYPLIIENEIKKRNGNFIYGKPAAVFLEIDGRLVTGQNFQSAKEVALTSIEISKKKQN